MVGVTGAVVEMPLRPVPFEAGCVECEVCNAVTVETGDAAAG